MKRVVLILALAVSVVPAHAAKLCGELKSEIAAKIDKKGVKSYTLEVVASDKVGDAKVVGSCDAGANKIIYKKK